MKKLILILIAITAISLDSMARQPERGYRGFIEWSNDYRTEDFWGQNDRSSVLYTGVSTSHGYQFNPWLYVGGGLVYEHCSKISSHILAPFVHGRTDLVFGKFTPFGDMRIGYNLSQGGGVYFSPNIGYRFNWGRKMGINLGLGLTVQGYKIDVFDIIVDENGYTNYLKIGSQHRSKLFFSFRLGFDF